MAIPEDPAVFYTHPIFILALIIGLMIVFLTIFMIVNPSIRQYFKFLFKIYYAIAFIPMYIIAGIIYVITIKKVNFFEKLREINFYEKFKNFYLEPTESFKEMREKPGNYHIWLGIFVSIVFPIFNNTIKIILAEEFYHGQESIIFGFLNPNPPSVTNIILRWILNLLFGLITFIPSYFTIHFLGKRMSKSEFDLDRPKFDQVRLIYIAWVYLLFPDVLWSIGFLLTLSFPIWEAMIFTWVFGTLCGIIELTYQVYSINGIYDIHSKWKSFAIWLVSMIPAFIFGILFLDGIVGPMIENCGICL